ncbi:MAG: type II secretion system protein N [Pseudomonadota bacterium]
MHDLAAKLARPARWLLVAAIAYTLATSVLYFLSPPPTGPASESATQREASSARSVDLNRILAGNLFGEFRGDGDGDGDDGDASAPAVATRLPLELHGVFVAEDPEDSAAIIAQSGKPGLLYTVGDELPGNATLTEVRATHVVLRRAGMQESLRFPTSSNDLAARSGSEGGGAGPAPPDGNGESGTAAEDDFQPPPPADQPEAGNDGPPPMEAEEVRQVVDDYRQRLDEDPQQALEELGVSPVNEGQAEGYRVDELADSPYLRQTGLQRGDVILSVNGRPVGDLQQDRQELDDVLSQGSARIEVQRGGRRFFVTASLPQ